VISDVIIINIIFIRSSNSTVIYFVGNSQYFFYSRSQICEKRLLASTCLSVCRSVRTEQHGSHWTYFHEISYLSIFRKSVEKIKVLSKSDRNNGYFICRPT
jgi:hypothetical protein